MRQLLSDKKVMELKQQTDLPIIAVSVRGGEDHTRHLCLDDGSIVILFKDGTMKRSNFRHSLCQNPSEC